MSDPVWRRWSGETDEEYKRRIAEMTDVDFTGKLDTTPAAKPGRHEKNATKDKRCK